MGKKPLIPLVLLAAIGAAVYWWTRSQEAVGPSSTLTLYGNVDIREVNLAFGTTEHVADVVVEEGDRVEPGQVLGRLRTDKLEAAVAAAEAQLEAQTQALAALEAGSRPEEIRRARAQADALKARARTAQITFSRQEKLVRKTSAGATLTRTAATISSGTSSMACGEASSASMSKSMPTLMKKIGIRKP